MQLDLEGLRGTEMLRVLVLTPLAVHSGVTCALVIEGYSAWTFPVAQQESEYSWEYLKLSRGLSRLILKAVIPWLNIGNEQSMSPRITSS